MIRNNRNLKNSLKRKIGLALPAVRESSGMTLKEVAGATGLCWQEIDRAETGDICGWSVYRKLLCFYNKDADIVLTDDDKAAD